MRHRLLLVAAAALVVVYCTILLIYTATTPDLRLRCLLADELDETEFEGRQGVIVRHSPAESGLTELPGTNTKIWKGVEPKQGDLLVRIGNRPIRSFADFTPALESLRAGPIGSALPAGSDPSELPGVGTYVSILREDDRYEDRYVEVECERAGWDQPVKGWLVVQSLPWSEVLLSFVWFFLQLGIFAISALAVWNRPFDRPARLFFAMCTVTLVAFVGGFHWWVTSGSLALNVPFAVCAILVPAVSLHFFLTYPYVRGFLETFPRAAVAGIYAVPVATALFVVGLLVRNAWINAPEGDLPQIHENLVLLRQVIYVYLIYATGCFAAMLVALAQGFFSVRDPLERAQLKVMFWAGLFAALPIGYTVAMALWDRIAFALGSGRVPMFVASVSFMLAYAVAIARYKLMLAEQLVTKGMKYYAATAAVSVSYAAAITFTCLWALKLNVAPSPQQVFQQTLAVGMVVMLVVVLLLWLRDAAQRLLDSWFYREKYQLDRAFQRMNRAVGHLVDRRSLAERMLVTCRDILRVDASALYFREPGRDTFQLVASDGIENIPLHFAPDPAFIEALQRDSTLQRISHVRRGTLPPTQAALRQLRAQLVHALEIEDDVSGFVLLSGKRGSSGFTAEDLTFLNALGQITSIAMHSARVHQDINRLNEELRRKVDRIATQKRQIAILQSELTGTRPAAPARVEEEFRCDDIKGKSAAIRSVLETVRKVAPSTSSVLIRGESGTGKELIAQAIHENSPRREHPLVRVHCAALAPNLLESELFGHVKGAFTGAHRDRTGRFEAADGGTIFLDEIGDISLDTQIKLLRVLQERCFERVGGSETVHVDVRVIAATHQNLEHLIAEGKFREDLYYRLNVISLTMPPLRERRDDVLELAFHFLHRAATSAGKPVMNFDDEALRILEHYAWPGNIRELENVIERAVVLADGDTIEPRHLPETLLTRPRRPSRRERQRDPRSDARPESQRDGEPAHPETPRPAADDTDPSQDSDDRSPVYDLTSNDLPEDILDEAADLLSAFLDAGGNKSLAARRLGMPRSTYYSKFQKLGIQEYLDKKAAAAAAAEPD
jgi:transcriptional regulator with GAF, ATPase, and Fis domain